MIEWEVTDSGLRALDSANVEVSVSAPSLGSVRPGGEIPRPTDEVVECRASELRFPEAFVFINDLGSDRTYEIGTNTDPVELGGGDYLVNLGTGIKTYVRFRAGATVYKTDELNEVVISFADREPITLGFRSRHEYPAGTIRIPPTPEGLATALSHLHSGIKTTSPDRSFPTLRGHPPTIEVADSIDIPPEISNATDDTGIRVVAPPDIPSLLVLAPLIYYLQAEVVLDADGDPAITDSDGRTLREFSSLPTLQDEVAGTLRRLFFLDCLVRTVGPHGTNLAEASVLDDLPLDPEWAYEAEAVARLEAYLDQPDDVLTANLPDWHLSTYVEPTVDNLTAVPFLLNKLSLVWLPETLSVTSPELIDASLDDFYRASAGQRGSSARQAASVDVVKPVLKEGRNHVWLADGIPIDVIKTTRSAFEHRLEYLERDSEEITVQVVLNDEEMEDEHREVERIYRERSEELPLAVSVHEHLSTDELATVFEADNDFVHYIGHCDESGLRCTDGNLSIEDIEESNTQTFFLNACGSYYEGMELVEKGSVAGAVTLSKVLNKQAAKVGTTFARLLSTGFSLAKSMDLARRRIMTSKDYAVVGDGTHSLTQCDSLFPLVLSGGTIDEDTFHVESEMVPSHIYGGVYVWYPEESDQTHLCGSRVTYEVERETLLSSLDRTMEPIIFDGTFYWPEELQETLG